LSRRRRETTGGAATVDGTPRTLFSCAGDLHTGAALPQPVTPAVIASRW